MNEDDTVTKCEWPGCNKIGTHTASIPAIAHVCQYHYWIVAGGSFVKRTNTDNISGPFYTVQLMESVMAAREMTKLQQPTTEAEVRTAINKK